MGLNNPKRNHSNINDSKHPKKHPDKKVIGSDKPSGFIIVTKEEVESNRSKAYEYVL